MSALRTVNLHKNYLFGIQTSFINSRHISNGNPQVRNGGQYQKIADAYAGKSVFMTGGTGFLGKVLIERLLYNCEDIKTIYVLIRQKKDVPLEKRLEHMFSLPLFSKLKETRPQDLAKVVPVQGDLLEEELGIKKVDQKNLEENTDMVFHVAASVMFRDSFRDLMKSNYDGTRKVMDFAKKVKNLEVLIAFIDLMRSRYFGNVSNAMIMGILTYGAGRIRKICLPSFFFVSVTLYIINKLVNAAFVYFSTAYCNVASKYLDEKLCLPLASPEDIEYCLKTGDTQRLRKISKAPIYTFSKNLTEILVDKEKGNLPTIIIRPSAVTATARDPFPGWMDTWISHPSIFTEHARGLISVVQGHKDVVGDIIPCDHVCNLAIVAAARGKRTKDLLIYNCSTGSTNPTTWKEGFDMFRELSLKDGRWDLPPRKLVLSSSPLAVYILTIIRDRIPALLGDLYLTIKGEKPRYLKLQKRALFMRETLGAMTDSSLFFKSTRPMFLAQTLDEEDRERFQFDTTTIDWPEYISILYKSVYKYMMKNK